MSLADPVPVSPPPELISLSFPAPKVFLNLFYPLSWVWVRTCLCVTVKPGSSFTVRTCSCCPVICVCSSAFTEPQPDSASIMSPPLSLLQSVCLYSRPEPWLCNTLPVANILPVFPFDHVCLPDLTCLPACLLTAAERPCPKLPFNSICCAMVSTLEPNFLCELRGSWQV